jgi:hypothetical protein
MHITIGCVWVCVMLSRSPQNIEKQVATYFMVARTEAPNVRRSARGAGIGVSASVLNDTMQLKLDKYP